MLNGIDDIDWAALDGAYGPCTEAPDILRGLASPDPDVVDEAMFEFGSSLWHQGTVYPATAEVVPFLVELAVTEGIHRRPDLLRILGELCDPRLTRGPGQPLVRAAVAVHSGPLLPLLADADPRIRLHAAFAAAHSGPHAYDSLRERWASEDHPPVRASVLAGLSRLEPAATVPLLEAALHDPSPELRATAATVLAGSGVPLPPDVLEPVGEALALVDTLWAGHRSAWEVVFAATEPAAAAILGAPLARSADPSTRSRLLHSIHARLLRSRSSVPALLPLVAALLTDPDPEVRADAAVAALAAGPLVAPLLTADPVSPGDRRPSGETAPAAGGPAAGASPAGMSVAGSLLGMAGTGSRCALRVLVHLGHPGYPEALAAAWDAGTAHEVLSGIEVPFDPAALAVIRRAITAPGPGSAAAPFLPASSRQDFDGLLGVLESWGPAAAPAFPEIVALLNSHPDAAALALAAIGPAALPAIPALTGRAGSGDVPSGHAILRLTGDTGPLLTAAAAVLPAVPSAAGIDSHRLVYWLGLIADAGADAAVLVPGLARMLGGTPEDQQDRRVRVAAARVIWRATGDAAAVLPTLREVVGRGSGPAGDAAELLAELGAGQDLIPELRKLLQSDPDTRRGAALALHRLGVPADELAGPLVAAVPAGGSTATKALTVLAGIGAVSAIPDLVALADRDERFPAGILGDESWADDRLRDRIRATITALEGLR
ncbi:HEAT repeat domain-containing protein [Actinoplanes subglobosus]|uniref:HEAT repeat domain-containing protein n=1 Tax=Actinoplanes subglobosus TaxID=1547892 RepID=A0ABV8IJ02_9ACTN